MCKLKSGIILKDRVYIAADTDSHANMLDTLKIEDTKENAERLFVRAELSPKDGDIFSDPKTWTWNVDQDILPEWYVEECDKERFLEAVREWHRSHVFVGVKGLTLNVSSGAYYLKDCDSATVRAYGSATVKAYGSATVMAYDNTTVMAHGSATVKAYGSAAVEAYGNATVEAYGSATVMAYDNTTVMAHGSATVKAYGSAAVEAYGNATVRACDSATVRAYGSATVKAHDSATVEAYGSATVEAYGNATVRAYGSATVKAYGSTRVEAHGSTIVSFPVYSPNKRENVVLLDNSTLKDCRCKTLYQSGGWKLVMVNNSKEQMEGGNE